MYKNQLQELAQRSCFNLPSYACIREGPDHAPRFKASVNFNGEIFESPNYCTTLRQAEHSAAEVALNVLSTRGPSRSLTARILDETGIYKNLLQETAHRAGLKLPVYTTVRSGPGHVPTFTCSVELAGMNFTGEPAKTKKQAEKNAAIAAWSALKRNLGSLSEEQDQAVVTRVLSNFRPKDDNFNKQFIRRREQIQPRRRMAPIASSSSSSSSMSSTNNSLQSQHWRLMDLLNDLVPEVSAKKQNSFASLLPPPPPRTASKILPPTTTLLNKENSSSSSYTFANHNYRPIPVQVKTKGASSSSSSSTSQVILPPPLMEAHQRDEEEWLGTGKSADNNSGLQAMKKAVEKEGPGSNSNSSYGYRKFLPMPPNNFSGKLTTFGPISGGLTPHRIAPAVQIRSVIPVCAAPPQSNLLTNSKMPIRGTSLEAETAAIKSASTNSVPESNSSVSSNSKFNMPESSSTQLGSEFNKLQL